MITTATTRFRVKKTVSTPAVGGSAGDIESLASHASNPAAHPDYLKKVALPRPFAGAMHLSSQTAHAVTNPRRAELTTTKLDYEQTKNRSYANDAENFSSVSPKRHIVTTFVLKQILDGLGLSESSKFVRWNEVITSGMIMPTEDLDRYIPSLGLFSPIYKKVMQWGGPEEYAKREHTHDDRYARTGHNHRYADLPDVPKVQAEVVEQSKLMTADTMFDLIYPIGSIYTSITAERVEDLPYAFRFYSDGRPKLWTRVGSGVCLWSSKEDNSDLGQVIQAALPNIKGSVLDTSKIADEPLTNCDSITSSGALYMTNRIEGYGGMPTRNGAGYRGMAFDARRSNAIYSDTCSTVQPPAIGVTFWKRIDTSDTFVVTFRDYDGRIYSSVNVKAGETVAFPTPSSHTGMTFYRWVTTDQSGALIAITPSTPILQHCAAWSSYQYSINASANSTTLGRVVGGGTHYTETGSVTLTATPADITETDVPTFQYWKIDDKIVYDLTRDIVFLEGKTYYRYIGGEYVPDATVVPGETIPADTYYEIHTDQTLVVEVGSGIGKRYVGCFIAYKFLNVVGAVNKTTYGTVTGGGRYYPGDTVTLTATPEDADKYRFDHWNNDVNDTNPVKTFVVPKSNTQTSVTHTANFVLLRKVTFNLDGGHFPDTFTYEAVVRPAVFEEGKRYFVKNGDGTYTEDTTFVIGDPIPDDKDYYIGTIRELNSDNNILSVDDGKTVDMNSVPTPINEGQTFGGWFTNMICTMPFVPESVPITASRTIYAKWISAS